MFALIAALLWLLAALGVNTDPVDLVLLGVVFLALHFAFGTLWSWRRP